MHDVQQTPGLRPSGETKAVTPHRRYLSGVEINSFRGIPQHLDLTFAAPGSGPAAVVILGDNGAGKSSIVDALQFALQYQLPGIRGKATAAAGRCGLTDALPRVVVRLSDGTNVERRVSYDPDRDRFHVNSELPSGFARTPLVLRRADILRFWDTPAELRQMVFVHYFRPGQRPVELPQEREARLKAAQQRAKARRNESRRTLADCLKISPVEIPTEQTDFDAFVNTRLYGRSRGVKTKKHARLPSDIYGAVVAMRTAMKELRQVKKEMDAPIRKETDPAGELGAVLRDASADVTTAFRAISPSVAVASIRLTLGEETTMQLGVRATLANGAEANPARVLSEANRDLVAFLIFVAIAKASAARGQAQVMILDDVFQSIDGPIRVAALDYVVSELKGWQFIVTAHDRLWREQLLTILRRHNHPIASLEIAGWEPRYGPDVRATTGDVGAALRSSLEATDPAAIAVHAGRLVELIAHCLSWTLPVSVTRRRDDRYTLNDVWPPVYSKLKKLATGGAADDVERYLHLRNLLGAHINDWAAMTSLSETKRFGEAALKLLDAVRCTECFRWVEESPEAHTYVCRCGATRLTKGPLPAEETPAAGTTQQLAQQPENTSALTIGRASAADPDNDNDASQAASVEH